MRRDKIGLAATRTDRTHAKAFRWARSGRPVARCPRGSWHNSASFASIPARMSLAPTRSALPDVFALHQGELIALQVNAARTLGFADCHFHDTLADGSPAPALAVIPAGAFEYGAAPEEAAPAQDRPRRAAVIERS